MRILLATGHPYIPQIAGGAQSSMHELAHHLMRHGHAVAVAAGLSEVGWLALRNRVLFKLSRKTAAVDRSLGYDVFRAWFVWDSIEEILRQFKPDVVFAQSGFPVRIAAMCRALGVPVAIYLRNVEDDDRRGHIRSWRMYIISPILSSRHDNSKNNSGLCRRLFTRCSCVPGTKQLRNAEMSHSLIRTPAKGARSRSILLSIARISHLRSLKVGRLTRRRGKNC